jgi:DNA-binding protein
MTEELPLAAMEKLIKKAGSERVSESAKQELQNLLHKKIEAATKKAEILCIHGGRKTIKKKDILLSFEN